VKFTECEFDRSGGVLYILSEEIHVYSACPFNYIICVVNNLTLYFILFFLIGAFR